jgi:hypothetical protein
MTIRDPRETITTLYQAFRALDGATMEQCYAASARFDDPVFSVQGRERIGGLWRMLCEGSIQQGRADWRLDFDSVVVEGRKGYAHWEPRYRFGATGRRVHNVIDASFQFDEDGLILVQRDDFDLYRWSCQALGAKGRLLGWMPWFRTQLRKQAARRFEAWLARPRL